jgi:hypothetical protein
VAIPQGSTGKLAQITVEKKAVIEPFVDAIQGAEFLGIRPRRLLELVRAGRLPGHPIGQGRRKTWRFRLSELAEAMAVEKAMPGANGQGIIDNGSPRQPNRRN